jgi:hypothetical protein
MQPNQLKLLLAVLSEGTAEGFSPLNRARFLREVIQC